jgi:hypothetical protein
MNTRTASWLSVATVLTPGNAWAEVMDKEPSLVHLWSVAIVAGLLGYFAWRWRIVAGVVATLASVPLVWGFHWELTDPYVGSAIRQEAGQGYVIQAYLSMVLCLAIQLAGLAQRVLRGTIAPMQRG